MQVKSKINSKYWGWVKLGIITGSAQVIVQIVGIVLSICIIRFISKGEYALYTIANTLMGAMVLLSDSGISAGVMAEGGKVWQDKDELGSVLKTGLSMRKRIGIYFSLITIPILAFLLIRNGATPLNTAILILGVLVSFYASLSDSLLEIVPKLHQDIIPLQKNNLFVTIIRFTLTVPLILFLPFSSIIVLISGISRVIGNVKLKKYTYSIVSPDAKYDQRIEKVLYNLLKRGMPGAIYFCLSGQLNIWLMSFFGKENNIAEVGALGRLSMLLNVFITIFGTLYVPRFARIASVRNQLQKKYLTTVFLILVALVLFFLLCYTFSNQALWLLGPKYNNLQTEFYLSIAASSIGVLGGVVFTLISSRGWIMNPGLSVSVNVITIIVAAIIFNVRTVEGVLMINIVSALVNFILEFIYGLIKIRRMPQVANI